ncbi:MAG TPA: ubiquinol oxidase subunit II [Rhodanobacteraceae bacterium]|nr:ubiquinol oxidase subunit II [Rhodanobacteraceae bacterium]
MLAKCCRGLLLIPLLLLGGCNLVLLDPSGDVAHRQSDIMIITTIIIALIIVPVLVAIGVVAWRYRASNKQARFDPYWDHSPQLELVVWAVPLLIIIAVGAVSWIGTHQLDPYRSLDRIAPGKPVAADVKPLEVDVVSLRWKWLFLYPQYGIATVNELAAPVNRPIRFKLTADTMMDSFFVPALAGQIYTMPGMQTILHGVINKPGVYRGFSANFSGSGFTDMRFKFHGLSTQDFDRWVAKARAAGGDLDLAAYNKLRQPSRAAPVHYYAKFDANLYDRVLNLCVEPGQICKSQLMAADSRGGDAMQDMQGTRGHGSHGMSMPADAPKPTAPAAAAH